MHKIAWGIAALLLGACGSGPPSGSASEPTPTPEIPSVLEIVCHKDGSTELLNEDVQAQADGAHIRVDNRSGEPVSLNGAGLDFDEGVTQQVSRSEPGTLRVACWPLSHHTDPEPKRSPIRIHDPEGFWVAEELECPEGDMTADAILDYGYPSVGGPPVGDEGDPVDLTREQLKGLEDDDEIQTTGYPEAEFRSVAVVREDKTIAIARFSPVEGGGWQLGGYSACDSARIRS